MAEAEVAPRKRLIIKLRLPRSRTVSSEECKLKHDADTAKPGPEFMASEKRKKDQHCSTTEYSCIVVGKSHAEGSRTLSTDAQCKQKKDDDGADSRGGRKRRKLATSEGSKVLDSMNTKKEEEEHHNACSRIPRTGSKKEEEMKVVLNEKRMDRYQKMQCWVILKRFMVGRDGWAFNKTLDPKKLGILGNKCESVLLKPIGFEDIESKLNKFVYSGPDEFAKDMRLLFSYGFMYPQRDQIHRVARRFSDSFEITWKALTEKWSTEERKRNKIFKRERSSETVTKGRSRKWKKAT
ncbi:transcription factor GTE12-like [Arachis ipaensis]|uniref:transcription factor GTE12-like n=1 Tax=Arachis ipaensis TaxID=130454 RepID=UPI0007AF693C|nr:transcription factor GTE12-like [Arachis ipaensis]